MPGAIKNFIGREGFVWFLGVVEDRIDPEKLGRVRVRCFGWHTEDKGLIATEDLPWAHTAFAPNAANTYTPKEGDVVVGFFLDGDSAQYPVIFGIIPGKPEEKPDYKLGFSDPRTDFGSTPTSEAYPQKKKINEPTTNRLARGRTDGTIIETRRRSLKKGVKGIAGFTWDEPDPTFSPTYPYNNAIETESGHAFELDDTKNNERVHLAHKKGSFIELNQLGNRVEKVVKDNYTLIMGNDYVYVQGDCNITVGGNCNLKVVGKFNVEAQEINMSSATNVRIKASEAIKLESGSTTDIKAGATARIGSGGTMNLKGSSTNIQGSSVSIAGQITNKVYVPPHTTHGGSAIGKILSSGSAASPSGTGLRAPS